MALNDAKLLTDLKKIVTKSSDGISNVDETLELLADAIKAYVKSGDVKGLTADGKAVTGKLV